MKYHCTPFNLFPEWSIRSRIWSCCRQTSVIYLYMHAQCTQLYILIHVRSLARQPQTKQMPSKKRKINQIPAQHQYYCGKSGVLMLFFVHFAAVVVLVVWFYSVYYGSVQIYIYIFVSLLIPCRMFDLGLFCPYYFATQLHKSNIEWYINEM